MRPKCGFGSTCVPISAPRKPSSRTHRSSSPADLASREAKCGCEGRSSSQMTQQTSNAERPTPNIKFKILLVLVPLLLIEHSSQRFHRLCLLHFLAAFLAGAARVVIPEIE